MSRARTLANLGGVTSSATELNLLDGQTDLATQLELDAIPVFDDNVIQTNLALLAFKTAVNGSLAKYNLQDQIIDEFVNATGIDDGPSDKHILTSGAYISRANSQTLGSSGGNTTSTYVYDGVTYHFHKFTADASLTVTATIMVDVLIVAGGGGGGTPYAGGGGAGGLRWITNIPLVAASSPYTIVVGDGGAVLTEGDDSSAFGYTSTGGGRGGYYDTDTARTGGSGGGASHGTATGGAGNEGGYTPVEGYAGGSTAGGSAGGGGAGGAAPNNYLNVGATAGGVGSSTFLIDAAATTAFLLGTVTGTNTSNVATTSSSGGTLYLAGGGGGGMDNGEGAGGLGGGGLGSHNEYNASVAGMINTGSGGGGGGAGTYVAGAAGGDGVVIVKYSDVPDDLILQSIDTAAETVPTKADIVMLVEDLGSGVGVENTDIKAFISRDSGVHATDSWTEANLVDEGHWGTTDKRILVAHDISLTEKNSGQAMCYKITTHNADSAKNTKIHATSIGWR